MKEESEPKRKRHQLSDPDKYKLIHPLAKSNRKSPTAAEDKLWQYLRNRQVDGFKFRRQHVVDKYVPDFLCIEARLVVEADGDIHEAGDHPQRDAERTEDLNNLGFRVLRFKNEEVLSQPLRVIDQIRKALHEQMKLDQ